MKHLLTWVACLVLAVPALGKGVPFSIRGTIDGLHKGDTLWFRQVTYPAYELKDAFFVLADAHGSFHYQGKQEHTNEYSVRYIPVEGNAPKLDRMGFKLFVGSGDRLTLKGERQLWGYCTITGGVYDHPIYRQIRARQDTLGVWRSTLFQQAEEARERKDIQTAEELMARFNRIRTGSSQIDSLWKLYWADPTAEENAAVELLAKLNGMELDELERDYALLSDRVKATYHGRLLTTHVESRRLLASGNPAPDFALTNDQGTVRLADFRGKYLLIYHWGACPGSIQIDPQVQVLWGEVDKERVAMVAVTEGRADVETLHANVSPGTTFAGLDLKECLSGMLAHPFADYDLNRGENKKLSEVFAFGGLPYFVLIDPEGNIAGRGFFEVFFEAQKMLPRKQTVKGDA